MIVRIAGEGQYRLPDGLLAALNELDNAIVEAVDQGEGGRYQHLFEFMLRLVRNQGQPVDVEELIASDIVLPASDTDFEEAEELFREEGLLSG